MNTERMKIHFSVWSMVIVIIGLGYLGYLRFLDGVVFGKVLEIKDPLTLQTTKDEYRIGEIVEAKISFCKYRDIKLVYQWQIVDGILITFPEKTTSLIPGCRDFVVPLEIIPHLILQKDVAHFEGTISYEVNPLRMVIVRMKTNNFSIIQ